MKKTILALLVIGLSFSSCTMDSPASTPTQTASSGAAATNVSKQFSIPVNAEGNTAEQQNILDKQKITSNPNTIMWFHYMNLDGKIVWKCPVRGKVTSSTKRLEPTSCIAGMSNGQGSDDYYGAKVPGSNHLTSELIQVDGTFGTSDPYVFWFDPQGNYFQVGSNYIISNIPIALGQTMQDIHGMFQIDKDQKEWADHQKPAPVK